MGCFKQEQLSRAETKMRSFLVCLGTREELGIARAITRRGEEKTRDGRG